MKTASRYRWFVVATFFAFMLLHQADKLLIGPLTTPIMDTFQIDEAQMGAVSTGALIIGAIFYPLWGYLYDRYARSRLLALASALWGMTTWISAIAPTYPTFIATRASTGVDDSSYPGLFSLIADYFGPTLRGKVYGLLQLAQPLGYMLGMVLALLLGGVIGWRNVFLLTGGVGIALAVVIFFGIREAPRGRSEPELADLAQIGIYQFDWQIAKGLFRKRTLIPLFIQGFFGVFPWNVIAAWFFRYLETERGYNPDTVLITMAIAVAVLAAGYFVGGAAGDFFFKRTRRGRLLVAMSGVITGAVLLALTLGVPPENQGLFLLLLCLTALFIPLSSANVISTVYDITLPEVRSTALAVQYFIENSGAALAPLITGLLVSNMGLSLGGAILLICTTTWVVGAFFLGLAAYVAPQDIETLRAQMRARAGEAQALQAAGTPADDRTAQAPARAEGF